MRHTFWLVALALVLPACGDPGGDDPAITPWQSTRLEELKGASGLTLFGDDLVLVAGGDDRSVYTVARGALKTGGTTATRTLAVTIHPKAPTSGSERFALQGYQLQHLWDVPVDFQAVAAQRPNFLYIGERNRRVVFWGRMTRDADGQLARVHLDHLMVAPGADRTASDAGDWRDKGSGLRGLVAVERAARQEDLWLVEEGLADKPIVLRRLDRYGGNFQGMRARHGFEVSPDCRAVSWDRNRLVVMLGGGRGRFVMLRPPPRQGQLDSIPQIKGVPGPAIDGATGWTGMAHAPDGTVFLVSGDEPAILAWRKP